MGKHKPCVIYSGHLPGRYPNFEICTVDEDTIRMSVYRDGPDGFSFTLPRRDARLFAKRINRCLDDTLSKGGK